MKIPRRIAVLALAFAVAAPLTAQSAADEHWSWTVAPYVLFPTMQGTTTIGDMGPVDVNASASDIFSHLQFGAMLYAQARRGAWAFALDGIYMDLSQDVVASGALSGSATMKQFAFEGFAFRRIAKSFEVMLGALGNSVAASVTTTILVPGPPAPPPPLTRTTNRTRTWGMPVAGFRWTPVDGEKWHVLLFADIGGLGSTNWSYQVLPSVGYRFGRTFELDVQYRWLGLDYKTGPELDQFTYDMNIFGPEVGFVFHL
jgi:hypothetical protein